MTEGTATTCLHCGLPTNTGESFCCHGCATAYQLIHSLGLGAYYRQREGESRQAVEGMRVHAQQVENLLEMAQPIDGRDGEWQMRLHVEGLHCPSCLWLLEHALQQWPDVTQARVNLTTRRIQWQWRGEREAASKHIERILQLGYPLHPLHEVNPPQAQASGLLKALAIAGFGMGNVMLFSAALWTTTGEEMGHATRGLLHWLSALIAIPCIILAGQVFYRSAWSALRQGHTNMDVPITVGVILATLLSLWQTATQGEHAYFDSVTMLLFFLLLGRFLDAWMRQKAFGSAESLVQHVQGRATVLLEDGTRQSLPVRSLQPGMRLHIATGDVIPVDSVVEEGQSEVDNALVTGESLPEMVVAGCVVYAGTTNIAAPLICRATHTADQSLCARMLELVEQAERSKTRYIQLADKAAAFYTPIVHALALASFVMSWWMGLPWPEALMRAVTVLIITCPCALGLAVPAVQVTAVQRLLRCGILPKNGNALERLAKVSTVVLDKTGTLTFGKPRWVGKPIETTLLAQAMALAQHSRHPLAQALVGMAEQQQMKPVSGLQEVQEVPGQGVEALWNGQRLRLGRREWAVSTDMDVMPETLNHHMQLWFSNGVDIPICLPFEDCLRSDAKEAVQRLQQAGLEVWCFSGDRESVVQHMAQQAGLQHWRGAMSPLDKLDAVKHLQRNGQQVLMVGDGLNDAAVLAAAQVSMAPSSGLHIAQQQADMVYLGQGLGAIYQAWELARLALRRMRQNLGLAVLYNMIAVPVAVLGYVTPMVAALAMSGSSILVVANALRMHTPPPRT